MSGDKNIGLIFLASHSFSQWRRRLERSGCKRKAGGSNTSRDRPKSYKQVVTAPQPKVRQHV